MKVFFVVNILVLSSFIARLATAKPIDIIFRGGDCTCAGPEFKDGCEHGILQGYGSLGAGRTVRIGGGGCNSPGYRIYNPNNNVKYIFDYDVQIPIETTKIDLPLTNLVARVDKILIDQGSAQIVNSGCDLGNAAGAGKDVVAPIPLPGRICNAGKLFQGSH